MTDQLTSILALVPDEDKPRVAEIIVSIMAHQAELDRLRSKMLQAISDEHTACVAELRGEIDDISAGIELLQIQVALAKKCHEANIDPVIADRLINRCRFVSGRLLITDGNGRPLTFSQAVRGLKGTK